MLGIPLRIISVDKSVLQTFIIKLNERVSQQFRLWLQIPKLHQFDQSILV